MIVIVSSQKKMHYVYLYISSKQSLQSWDTEESQIN